MPLPGYGGKDKKPKMLSRQIAQGHSNFLLAKSSIAWEAPNKGGHFLIYKKNHKLLELKCVLRDTTSNLW